MSDRTLVTGFPTYLARRLVRRLLETSTEEQVTLLCRTKFSDEAQQFVRDLPPERARRCRILIGDICDIDLGLAGVEYTTLASEVTTIYHAAVISQLAAGRERIERVHVDGTRTVIDLASESPKLRRLVHLSTAAVAGARQGVVMEDELERGQRFRNLIEESRFEAEKLVQSAARRLPTTVVRPATIVGDSRTGEIHRLDGPYHFLQFLLTSPLDVSVPLPGRGAAPLHLVPIDFVVDAMVALGRHPAAAGSTFHLTDPWKTPLTCSAGDRRCAKAVRNCASAISRGRRRPCCSTGTGSWSMASCADCGKTTQCPRRWRWSRSAATAGGSSIPIPTLTS